MNLNSLVLRLNTDSEHTNANGVVFKCVRVDKIKGGTLRTSIKLKYIKKLSCRCNECSQYYYYLLEHLQETGMNVIINLESTCHDEYYNIIPHSKRKDWETQLEEIETFRTVEIYPDENYG